MKPRSKWLYLLFIAATIAALGSFVFVNGQSPGEIDAQESKPEPESQTNAQKTPSKDSGDLGEDVEAPPHSLRFVRGADAESVAVFVNVGTPGHYPPREGEVEEGGFFELPEALEVSTWDEELNVHEVYARSEDNKDAFWSFLPANKNPDEAQVVTLRPASPLNVEVVDPAGEPLVGAKVRLSHGLIGMVHQTEITSEDGEALLGAIPEGDFQLSVYADGFVRHTRHLLHTYRSESEVATTQVILDRGATVTGRVVDEFGVVVAGADVAIIPVSPFADEIIDADFLAQVGVASQIGKSDAQGRFSMGGIATGAVQVRADAPGYGAGLSALIRVKGDTSTKIDDIVLTREEQRDDLLVRVLLSDPTVKLNAVELRVPSGHEDAGRRCRGSRLNARDWRFVNCGKGSRELIATTTTGVALHWKGTLEEEDEITLNAPRRLEVFVVDAVGAPVSGAFVQIWQDGEKLLEATSRGADPIRYDTAIPFRATIVARDARRGAGQYAIEIAANAGDQAANEERAVVTLDRELLELSFPPGVLNHVEEIERHLGAQIVQDDHQWIVDRVPADSGAGQAGIQRGDHILMLRRVGEEVEAIISREGERLRVIL